MKFRAILNENIYCKSEPSGMQFRAIAPLISPRHRGFEKIVLLRKAPPKLIYLKTYDLDTKQLIDLIIDNKDEIILFEHAETNDIFEIYAD